MIARIGLALLLLASPAYAEPQNVANKIWQAAGQKGPAPKVVVSPHVPNAVVIDGEIVLNPAIASMPLDPLAFFIAHETVHLIRNHGPSFNAEIRARQELEADYSGMALAIIAGYDRNKIVQRLHLLGDGTVYCPWTVRAVLLSR